MKKKLNAFIKKSTILTFFKTEVFKRRWRNLNEHNFTTAKNSFDSKKVSVGKGTYGELDVRHFGSNEEKLIIGNYCSIAPEVSFVLGGEHRYDTISTFPFGVKYGGVENESIVKGPIVVEDDVWIGFRSTILSGVTLGRGSIVAAGSVVTKDVPPYAIVGGVPAKVIKYRFSQEIILNLMKINYANIEIKEVLQKLNCWSEELNEQNIKDVLGDINGYCE